MEINYDDERFDLTQQAWVNHIPKTDDEMWLQAICNDIFAKWQSDKRVSIQMMKEMQNKLNGYEKIIKDLVEVSDRHEAHRRELEKETEGLKKEVTHWMKEKDKAEKMLLQVRESIGKYFRKELPASDGKYQSGNPKLSDGASDWYPKDQRKP